MASKFKGKDYQHQYKVVDHEPIHLGRRLVLRRRGQVPVELLVRLRRLYINDSIRANEVLCATWQGEPTDARNTIHRCAIQALYEE